MPKRGIHGHFVEMVSATHRHAEERKRDGQRVGMMTSAARWISRGLPRKKEERDRARDGSPMSHDRRVLDLRRRGPSRLSLRRWPRVGRRREREDAGDNRERQRVRPSRGSAGSARRTPRREDRRRSETRASLNDELRSGRRTRTRSRPAEMRDQGTTKIGRRPRGGRALDRRDRRSGGSLGAMTLLPSRGLGSAGRVR